MLLAFSNYASISRLSTVSGALNDHLSLFRQPGMTVPILTILKEAFEVLVLKGRRRRAAFGGSCGVPSYIALINLWIQNEPIKMAF